jgi:hypothetical protein
MPHSDKILIHEILNLSFIRGILGMNPFLNNNTHNTWPSVVTILNLPLWFCNKQKYIMLSGLILGPQQHGNDIDTYFMPFFEDLKVLWYNKGVEVLDEHKYEYFQYLFVTVSDSPVTRNLLGQSKKVGCRCPRSR